jgi:hypothetical protein
VNDVQQTLDTQEIAVSISEPDPGELAARGVSEDHVSHAFLEIARQLLAAGATLSYGGDFRKPGYTHKLITLLNGYSTADRPPKQRVRQYLAWPLWQQASARDRGDLNQVATVINVPAPIAEAPDGETFDRRATSAARALWADALTEMRRSMTTAMSARVILGGRLTTHSSRYPGLVEEAFVAASARKPMYVLGGFGGCASSIAQVIRGQRPEPLTLDYQLAHTEGYPELLEGLGSIDYEHLLDTLRDNGPGRVANGLTDEENDSLLDTADPDLVVALVLRGLRRL